MSVIVSPSSRCPLFSPTPFPPLFAFHFPPFALPNLHVRRFTHRSPLKPSWPPRESSERAWGSLKCGSTSWREMQHGLRRLRAMRLSSTRLVCVSVCEYFRLGTLGTDVPIISLISGITLRGSDSSRHTFSQSVLFHQAWGYIPYSPACGIYPFSLQESLIIWV